MSCPLQTLGYYHKDKIFDWSTRYRDLEESYSHENVNILGLLAPLARTCNYEISQVCTLLTEPISWVLRIEAHVVSTNMWYTNKLWTRINYHVSDAKTENVRLARFARSRKLPLRIVAANKRNNNNYIESKLWWKKYIARRMCETTKI